MNIKKIILILLLLLWFYNYPLQRVCAEIRLSQYLEEKQQIETSKIISKSVWKDFKTAEYHFQIIFEEQEEKTYEYHYTFIDRTTVGWEINKLCAYVCDNKTSVVSSIGQLNTPIRQIRQQLFS